MSDQNSGLEEHVLRYAKKKCSPMLWYVVMNETDLKYAYILNLVYFTHDIQCQMQFKRIVVYVSYS